MRPLRSNPGKILYPMRISNGHLQDELYVWWMKTRWGSCTLQRRSIRLNTEFAKKLRECLEYIVVHEMVHLLEPTHNKRFAALMDRFLPNWKHIRAQLNQLPVRDESWLY